jgi:hypothetical protein
LLLLKFKYFSYESLRIDALDAFGAFCFLRSIGKERYTWRRDARPPEKKTGKDYEIFVFGVCWSGFGSGHGARGG